MICTPAPARWCARSRALSLLALAAFTAAACGRKAGPAAGPPAMPVEVVTLATHPVEQTTEFVGTVKSRRSTTVQPQVEGFVTRILARSGDRVRAGMPLLEGGAASKAELEQAQTALSTSEAQLRAIDAQIREQRVALGYHRVSATTAGVVGDIPVRVGDTVTRSTVLTTIDQSAGLEVYINVPVQEAQNLRVGLPVHLLDDRGAVVSTEKVSFVAPSVDSATQSVLAKAVVEKAGFLRTEQFVRAQIVWTEAPALTAPLVALNRINGQFFAYVAEPGDGGTTVAHQRAVEPGPLVGNDYVVKSGLKAGEKLIVSGVQKIRDGSPVAITATGASPAPAPPASGKAE
jgi:RND family efflux transporter MFP subunit